MRELDSTFDKRIFEFMISGLIRSINFTIDEIKIVETALNELLALVIAVNEHNDVILLDCEQTALFVYNVMNNQIEIDYIRFIKHMNLNINRHKNIVNFIESHQKKLNEIRLRQ